MGLTVAMHLCGGARHQSPAITTATFARRGTWVPAQPSHLVTEAGPAAALA